MTLIAGGGFHGKSTILNALAVGVYVGGWKRRGGESPDGPLLPPHPLHPRTPPPHTHTRTPPPRHDKVPGDGRALVLASPDALTLRAEDGRSVRSVDISAFVNSLPKASGLDTTQFSTDCASGSTSMAAR